MERKQHIRKPNVRTASITKEAMNWTNSGAEIINGINIIGAVRLCSCGAELLPYQDSCPSCNK